MTYTLTWGFKSLQLPKLNTNLLSVLSFCLVCLMLFTVASAIVEAVCESEYSSLQLAEAALGFAMISLVAAETGLVLAIASLNPIAIGAASLGVAAATGAVTLAGAAVLSAQKAYEDCLDRHTAGGSSGSCSS